MSDITPSSNLIFYAVYALEFDSILVNQDILSEIREEMFTTGSKVRNKVNLTFDNKIYKYSYVLSPKIPLKWKKTYQNNVIEKSFIRPDSSYSVITQDINDNFVNKNITFSHDHKWIYTQYFDKNNKKTPILSLTALSNNVILLKKKNAMGLPIKVNLIACEYPENEKERNAINDEFGEPEVLVKTNAGLFYYCESKIAQLRKEALEKFRKFSDDNAFIDDKNINDNSEKFEQNGTQTPVINGFKINKDFVNEQNNDFQNEENLNDKSNGFFIADDKKDSYDWGIQQNYTDKKTSTGDGFSIQFTPTKHTKAIPVEEIKLPDVKNIYSDINSELDDELSISKDAKDVLEQAEDIKDRLNDSIDSSSVEKFINDITNESNKEKEQIDSFFENKINEIDNKKNMNHKYEDLNQTQNNIEHIPLQQNSKNTSIDNKLDSSIQNNNANLNNIKMYTDFKQKNCSRNKLSNGNSEINLKNDKFPQAKKYNTNSFNNKKTSSDDFNTSLIERNDEACAICMSDDINLSPASSCPGASSGCPYKIKDKMNITISDNERYYYFGEIIDNLRQGEGRTVMENGHTAYEGGYHKDKREGFGVYYYKTGKLCHVGRWKNNKRHGTGIAFRPTDGTITVGNWIDDVQVGISSSFDGKGNLLYAGVLKNGRRNGVGVSYCYKNGGIFVGQWDNGKSTGKGTEFDVDGNLLYTGNFKNQRREGFGTQYNENGDIVYIGNWKNDKYDGYGSLHLENGNYIKGIFENGNISNNAEEFDECGFKIYEGEWSNNKYNGKGCKYFKNGGRYEGKFVDGEPYGYLSGYDCEGELVYEGEWKNDMFNGNGSYYINGEKVYDGSFVDNNFHGNGFEYKDGIYVYSGGFRNSRRCGFGTSYSNGKPIYSGTWLNDLYDGLGILFENGEPVLAGEFSKGKKNGRANIISNGIVCEERIYKDDILCYAKKYNVSDPDSISLVYEGNIKNDKLNGLGVIFNKYGEKESEGLFSNGRLIKNIKVNLHKFEPLPKSNILSHTDYNSYRQAPEYVIEKQINKMLYTGPIKDQLPHGLGTAIYKDHVFIGNFFKGKPCGNGAVYQNDGTVFEGEFLSQPTEVCITLSFTDSIVYYYMQNK